MEQSLSCAVASVTKKVLVDFIKGNISQFNGVNNLQKKTKEELYALVALHSNSSLYHRFLQETKGSALQHRKSKQQGGDTITRVQQKHSARPYQSVCDKEVIDNLSLLPSILPRDIQQHIWSIKEELEYECEPHSYRTVSIHYTIPHINNQVQAIDFATETCSDVCGQLRYCMSFSTVVETSVDNHTHGYRFETTFYRVVNLDEDKINYYTDFLTQVFGATDVRHVPLFILRHGKSGYICDTFLYEEIQHKQVIQKVNEIVNKCVELLRLKPCTFCEESYRARQKHVLVENLDTIKKIHNMDDKSVYDVLQRIDTYKVLAAKGVIMLSLHATSKYMNHTYTQIWETRTSSIS